MKPEQLATGILTMNGIELGTQHAKVASEVVNGAEVLLSPDGLAVMIGGGQVELDGQVILPRDATLEFCREQLGEPKVSHNDIFHWTVAKDTSIFWAPGAAVYEDCFLRIASWTP